MTERTRPADPTFPALEGVSHHFVDLPGLRMHVAEAGSGEPVVLLHESLQTPTLVLFGTANPAFPPELVNLLLRDREAYADHLEVAFVDRAAHYIAEERPDAVIDHALKFFAAPSG